MLGINRLVYFWILKVLVTKSESAWYHFHCSVYSSSV